MDENPFSGTIHILERTFQGQELILLLLNTYRLQSCADFIPLPFGLLGWGWGGWEGSEFTQHPLQAGMWREWVGEGSRPGGLASWNNWEVVVRSLGLGWNWTFCTFNDHQTTACYCATTRKAENACCVGYQVRSPLSTVREAERAARVVCDVQKSPVSGQSGSGIGSARGKLRGT